MINERVENPMVVDACWTEPKPEPEEKDKTELVRQISDLVHQIQSGFDDLRDLIEEHL